VIFHEAMNLWLIAPRIFSMHTHSFDPFMQRRLPRSSAPAKWPVTCRHNTQVNYFSSMDRVLSAQPEPSPLSSEADHLNVLVSQMAQGQSSAIAQLYDATIARVYSLVRRFSSDDASAQDVTQEVYLQAWQQAGRFDATRGSALAWLLNLARSRALDAWRKHSSSPVQANSDIAQIASESWASAQQPIDFLDAADAHAALSACLQQLPAATRQMLSLAFFHDMTHQDISSHLHLPLGTVKSTLRRALLAMREHLTQQGLSAQDIAALSLENLSS
jgi:RNA polymerase sigma factor (sigma-70 family)